MKHSDRSEPALFDQFARFDNGLVETVARTGDQLNPGVFDRFHDRIRVVHPDRERFFDK